MKSDRILFVVLISSMVCWVCSTQKVYVPKQMAVPPRIGFLNGEIVDLAIFDGRANKEESTELINQIANQFAKTYPSAKFNLIDESRFFSDAKPNRITIRISIAAYSSGFGSNVMVGVGSIGGQFSYGVIPEGKWNGVAGFSINLYDYRRNAGAKFTKHVGKVVSKPNLSGYKTAQAALNESYQTALQELLFFIDASLMK